MGSKFQNFAYFEDEHNRYFSSNFNMFCEFFFSESIIADVPCCARRSSMLSLDLESCHFEVNREREKTAFVTLTIKLKAI